MRWSSSVTRPNRPPGATATCWARELRQTCQPKVPQGIAISPDVVAELPLASFLEFLAICVNGLQAQDLKARFDWQLDGGDCQRVTLSNGALNHLAGSHGGAADATIRTSRAQLARWLQAPLLLLDDLASEHLRIDGDKALVPGGRFPADAGSLRSHVQHRGSLGQAAPFARAAGIPVVLRVGGPPATSAVH